MTTTTPTATATVTPAALADLERLAQALDPKLEHGPYHAFPDLRTPPDYMVINGAGRVMCLYCTEAEARYIAAACNLAPALVAQLRELEEELEEAEQEGYESGYLAACLDDTDNTGEIIGDELRAVVSERDALQAQLRAEQAAREAAERERDEARSALGFAEIERDLARTQARCNYESSDSIFHAWDEARQRAERAEADAAELRAQLAELTAKHNDAMQAWLREHAARVSLVPTEKGLQEFARMEAEAARALLARTERKDGRA